MNDASLLSSTKSTRAILPHSLRYLRSDVPASLTEEEIEWLLANNVRTLIDLRTKEDLSEKPCCLSVDKRFTCLHMPVSGGDTIPESPDMVPQSYYSMVDDNMLAIINTIEGAKTNVLYFCNAGKDRTGVVSALLLRNEGFDNAYIIEDYRKSADNLREMLLSYKSAHPQIDLDIITPKREYMEGFLRLLS